MLGGMYLGPGAGSLDNLLTILVVSWGLLVVSSWFLGGLLVVGCRGRPARNGRRAGPKVVVGFMVVLLLCQRLGIYAGCFLTIRI